MINPEKKVQRLVRTQLAPLTVAMILALPAAAHSAGLNMKNGTLYNANGVPVVDINKPNSNGLSHNVWDNLNVDKSGVIFNNSGSASNTVLGGTIQGNSNLTSGSAKVILNEVTSKNASTINGMMEVAGDKAALIIANPNGITVNGGGTINTDKLTLTTGTPDIQNDKLAGYSVNGGTITISKLDNASPTEILSRNVVLSGKVTADELNIVAGNNYVNTDGQVTGTITASGSRNSYSVDVAQVGGMYANKINLISTESGVGVRNQGVIAGGTGGISIDANGQLLNSNAQIQSIGSTKINTNGKLDNTTGVITSAGAIYLDTNKNAIVNARSGTISTTADIYVNSGAFDNTNGKIAASGMLAVDTNNNTFTNAGKGNNVGIEAGIVTLKTGTLNNSNGQIHGGYLGLDTGAINNNSGILETSGDMDIASLGNIDNNKGLIRSAGGHIKIAAGGAVNNSSTKTADTVSSDSLGIAGDTSVEINANSINNSGGQIASNGDVSLNSKGLVNNDSGNLLSNSKVIVKGDSYRNDYGGIGGKKGVEVSVNGNLSNYVGVVSAEEGDISLSANAVDTHGGFMLGQNIAIDAKAGVNATRSLVLANKKMTINAGGNVDNRDGNSFGNDFGVYFGMPQQIGGLIGKGGVEISGQNIYNNNSRIIAENGAMSLQAKGNIDNTRALMVSGADTAIKTGGAFYNNYATIYSGGNLTLDTVSLENYSNGTLIDNNATGFITSDKDITLNVNNNFTNYGWISGKGAVALNVVKGAFYNRNTIAADKSLAISALNGIENVKDISAGGSLTLDSQRHVTNNNNSNMVGNGITINAVNDINNRGNIVSDGDISVVTKGNLYNYLYMLGAGDISITANNVTNNNSLIEAGGDLTITSNSNVGNNRGTLRSLTGDVNVTAKGTVDNYSGKIISAGDVGISGNWLRNDYGQIAGGTNIDLIMAGNFDNYRGSVTSLVGDIKLVANSVDNNNGLIAGENISIDSRSSVYNNTALIAANKSLTINAAGSIENRDGNNFGRSNSEYFGVASDVGGMVGKTGMSLSGQNIYNNNSSMIAENGPLSLLSRGTFDNTRAMLMSGANALIKVAGTFYNNYAMTYSAGNLDISAASLQNYSNGKLEDGTATGVIASDKNLNLSVDNSTTNYGWISGKGDVNFSVLKGVLYNRNTIAADHALAINALNGIENFKDILAGTSLTLTTQRHVTNNSNSNMLGQSIGINAVNDINNRGNIVSDYALTVKTDGNVYNYLNMLSYGTAKVTASKVTNSGKDAVLGGFYGLDLESNTLTNTGTIVGL